jgi:AI-2 transport protein TqsA
MTFGECPAALRGRAFSDGAGARVPARSIFASMKPEQVSTQQAQLPSGTGVLVAAASLVIVMTGLRLAAPVFILFAMAAFLVVVTRPAVAMLQARHVPTALAIALVVTLTFAVMALLITVATQSINDIRMAFPRYLARYEVMQANVLSWLAEHDIDVPPTLRLDAVGAERALDLAAGALRGLAGLMSATLLVIIVAIFGMIEADRMPEKARAAFGDSLGRSRHGKVLAEVQQYLAIKTAVSLVTGLLIGLWVWAVGLDFPVFWGLVAFILNFVPSIGSIMAAVPAVALAIIQLGANGAILTLIGYLGVNVLLGNIFEPLLLGRRLGLSPLVVILSVVFWGWLWGPIGFLLAVPLTMILRILLENTEEYRWIAVLMAPAPTDRQPRLRRRSWPRRSGVP